MSGNTLATKLGDARPTFRQRAMTLRKSSAGICSKSGSVLAAFIVLVASSGIFSVLATPALATPASAGSTGSVNLDQWANLPVAAWQNGDLNQSNSAYAENSVVPFRSAVTVNNTGITHTFEISYDMTKLGAEAYDFLASYNATESSVTGQLCASGGGAASSLCPTLGTASVYPFQQDGYQPPSSPGLTVSGAQALFDPSADNAAPSTTLTAKENLTMYGGTITGVSAPVHSGTPDDTATVTVSFTTASTCTAATCDVLFAWGGHLAESGYWNSGNPLKGVST